MARVGVVVTLIKSLQAKKSIFTSGAVRLTKNQFNVMINRSVIISKEKIGEFCGIYPHGTFSHSLKHMQVDVYRKGILEYQYDIATGYLNISIFDKYLLTYTVATNCTSITYKYMYYDVSIETNPGKNYAYTVVKSIFKTTARNIPINISMISTILDLDIPDHIKEPIRKLKS